MKSTSERSTGEVASLLLGDDAPSVQPSASSSGAVVKKSFDNENISTIDWRADYKKEKKKRARIFEQVWMRKFLFLNLLRTFHGMMKNIFQISSNSNGMIFE